MSAECEECGTDLALKCPVCAEKVTEKEVLVMILAELQGIAKTLNEIERQVPSYTQFQ